MGQSPEPEGLVKSRDGTAIAYWKSGVGPAVVLVHGTTSDHTTYDEMIPALSADRTVYTYDRRGRGRSEDAPNYTFSSEIDDAVAIIAEAAAYEGAPVPVFGHSFGAFIALAAAARTSQARAVVAYSPGFGAEYQAETLSEIESASASHDMDRALRVMFADVIGMREEDIEFMAKSPAWQVRVSLGHTIARECRADSTFLTDYADQLRALAAPVLVIDGETNTEPKRQIAREVVDLLPEARLTVLRGQGHAAHHMAPAELAALANRFFDEPEAGLLAASPSTP